MKPLRLRPVIPCLALGSALGATVFASITAGAQMPQTPGSNVLITKCDPRPYWAGETGFHVSPYRSGLRGVLAVAYENQAPVAATDVVFGLVSGGKLLTSTYDRGNFATGAAIGDDLYFNQDIFPLKAPAQCVVLRIRYTNGEAWYNPNPPQP